MNNFLTHTVQSIHVTQILVVIFDLFLAVQSEKCQDIEHFHLVGIL